jgi:hypothetical protein
MRQGHQQPPPLQKLRRVGVPRLLLRRAQDVLRLHAAADRRLTMKWISFNETLKALLAGAQTVTRRRWADSHAAQFKKGDVVEACDRPPGFGGRRVALIRLTHEPRKESTAKMTEADWFDEGMHVLEGEGVLLDGLTPAQFFLRRREQEPEDVWVIRFRVVGI